MHLSIRLVRDLPNTAIELLHKNLPRVNEPNYPRSVDDWKKTAKLGWAVVAFQGDKVVGVTLCYPDGRNGLLVGEIAVAEDFRRRGIGRKMIQTVEMLAKKRGFNELYLGAEKGAEGFYRKLGWWEYTYVKTLPKGAPLKISAKEGWIVAGDYKCVQKFFRKPLHPSLEVRRTESGYQILLDTSRMFAKTWRAVVDKIQPNLCELDYLVPFYRQKMGSANCGPVCAKMVLEFFGMSFSVPELLRYIPVKGGTWAPWMYRGLTELGMNVDVWIFNPPRKYEHELKMIPPRKLHHSLIATKNIQQLLRSGHLLIVSVNQKILYGEGVKGHYVVVRGFKGRKFYVVDPTFTPRFGAHLIEGWKLLRAVYSAKFGGEILAVQPGV